MRDLITAAAILFFLVSGSAALTVDYDWEDGGTILSSYGDIDAFNVVSPDPVHGGTRSLKLVDQAASGTPQAYVAWITGLAHGDTVEAGFWRYDTTPGAAPSCRIWAHYTPVGGDIDSYAGSADGNADYGPGTGWDYTSYTYVFDSDGDTRDGLVIECRTYSSAGDTVWLDDLVIVAPDHATVVTPRETPVAERTWGAIKALFR